MSYNFLFFFTILLLLISYRRLFGTSLIPLHSPAVHHYNTFQGFFFHSSHTEAEVYITYSIKELRGAPIKSFTVSSSPQEADDMARRRGGNLDTLSYLSPSRFFFFSPSPSSLMPVKTVHPGEMGVYVFTSSAKRRKKRRGREKKKREENLRGGARWGGLTRRRVV